MCMLRIRKQNPPQKLFTFQQCFTDRSLMRHPLIQPGVHFLWTRERIKCPCGSWNIKSKIGRLSHFESLFQQYICFWSSHPLSDASCRGVAVGHARLLSPALKKGVWVRIQLTEGHKAQNLHCFRSRDAQWRWFHPMPIDVELRGVTTFTWEVNGSQRWNHRHSVREQGEEGIYSFFLRRHILEENLQCCSQQKSQSTSDGVIWQKG